MKKSREDWGDISSDSCFMDMACPVNGCDRYGIILSLFAKLNSRIRKLHKIINDFIR